MHQAMGTLPPGQSETKTCTAEHLKDVPMHTRVYTSEINRQHTGGEYMVKREGVSQELPGDWGLQARIMCGWGLGRSPWERHPQGQQVRWRGPDLALSLIPHSSVRDIQCDPNPLRWGLSPITVPRLALHAIVLLNFPLPLVSEYHPDDHS